MTNLRSAAPTPAQIDTSKPHSAMPPEDRADREVVLFHLRGDHDLIACEVTWAALDRLEGRASDSAADRLGRFEQHRARIESAALGKIADHPQGQAPLRLEAEDILNAPNA